MSFAFISSVGNWNSVLNIQMLLQSLKLLSVLAAIRLHDESDDIDKTLSLALVEKKSNTNDQSVSLSDPLATSTWEKVRSFTFMEVFSHSNEFSLTVASFLLLSGTNLYCLGAKLVA